MRYFAPLVSGYGDLSRDASFNKLARDVVRLVKVHIHPWDMEIDADLLARTASPRSLFGLYAGLYDQYRDRSGKRRWGCKSTFMIDHVDEILARFPAARLLYLVRDPRDVAASSRASVFNPCHPRLTARLWREQQELGLSLLDRLHSETILLVRYERLLAEPAETVREICRFLGEEFEEGMLRYFERATARRTASLSESWANTASPVLRGRAGHWRDDLSPRDVLDIEAEARQPMVRLGYEIVNTGPDLDRAASQRPGLGVSLAEARMRLQVELRSLLKDRNASRRWLRGGFLAWLRWRGRLERVRAWQ
jgi:hypothetical protein